MSGDVSLNVSRLSKTWDWKPTETKDGKKILSVDVKINGQLYRVKAKYQENIHSLLNQAEKAIEDQVKKIVTSIQDEIPNIAPESADKKTILQTSFSDPKKMLCKLSDSNDFVPLDQITQQSLKDSICKVQQAFSKAFSSPVGTSKPTDEVVREAPKLTHTTPLEKPNPLPKVGNTCWMNSVLQSLLGTETVRKRVHEMTSEDKWNELGEDKKPLFRSLVEFMKAYAKGDQNDVKQQARELSQQFPLEQGKQHDTAEAMGVILDLLGINFTQTRQVIWGEGDTDKKDLEKEIHCMVRVPIDVGGENDLETLLQRDTTEQMGVRTKQDPNVIEEMTVTATFEEKDFQKADNTLIQTLRENDDTKRLITSCNDYLKTVGSRDAEKALEDTLLSDVQKELINVCCDIVNSDPNGPQTTYNILSDETNSQEQRTIQFKKKTTVKKYCIETRIEGNPKLLVLQLKRFEFNKGQPQKIGDPISYGNILHDGSILNLSCLFGDEGNHNYRIKAIIQHIGKSANSGHYTAIVVDPEDPTRANNCDNETVTSTTFDTAKKEEKDGKNNYIYLVELVEGADKGRKPESQEFSTDTSTKKSFFTDQDMEDIFQDVK